MHNQIDFANAHLMASPWAIAPGMRDAAIEALLHPSAARRGPVATRGAAGRRPSGRTALIGVYGILTQHATPLESWGLSTSCDAIARQLRSAMADPGVDRVVLDIDSQGGSVFGVAELSAEIRNSRGIKPVIGVANGLAASAAFWVGSACSEFYCTPSGQVGSIGVIAAHEDVSKALEAEGVSITLIAAGRFKTEGNSFAPLDAEGRGAMQSDVDAYHADFLRDVARGRGVSVDTVRRTFGEGRMMRGADAVRVGMADGTATFSDVLAGRARSPKTTLTASTLARMPAALARSMRMLALLDD